MKCAALDAYLRELERRLRARGVRPGRVVEEVRDHLVDGIRAGLDRGLSPEAAEREAFARVGPPEAIAVHFAGEAHPMSNWLVRLAARIAGRSVGDGARAAHFHDVSTPRGHHFVLDVKRRYRLGRMSADERHQLQAELQARGEDVAFDADPRERLDRFLREFGRRTFGPGETLDSLTLLDDVSGSRARGGRYRAHFSSGATMIWTVALQPDGGVSFDGIDAPGPDLAAV